MLVPGDSHRIEVVNYANKRFLEIAMAFLKKVATVAKNKNTDPDWYKKALLSEDLPKNEIATNAGINMKTIGNIYGSEKVSTVIDASNINYESIKSLVGDLIEKNSDIDMTIVINPPDSDSVVLDANESFVVMSALVAKHAALGGGLWSTIGKHAEKPLVHVLCNLYSVKQENYNLSVADGSAGKNEREVDFFLVDGEIEYQGEVKIVGRGNPENMDGPIARESKIVIADSLSERNKEQLRKKNIKWVKLADKNGHRHFATVLEELNILYKPYEGDLEKDIDKLIEKALDECGSC